MIESLLMGFWLLSFSLAMTPGADWAYVMSAGMHGRVWSALLGMLGGYLLVIFAVMAGVGAVVAAHPALLNALTLLGAAYLVWLGVQVLRSPSVVVQNAQRPQSRGQWIRKGIAVSGLNPKVLLMFVALIPPFLNAQAAWPVPAQIFTLGAMHLGNCAVIYSLVGLGIGALIRRRPHWSVWMSRFSGTAMLILAVALVAEQSGIVI